MPSPSRAKLLTPGYMRCMVGAVAVAGVCAVVGGVITGGIIGANIETILDWRQLGVAGRRTDGYLLLMQLPLILAGPAACWTVCKFILADGVQVLIPLLIGALIGWSGAFLTAYAFAPAEAATIAGTLIAPTIFFAAIGALMMLGDY